MIQDRAMVSLHGMQIGNRTQACEWFHFQLPRVTLTQISRSRHYLTLNMSNTVQDTEIVVMEY